MRVRSPVTLTLLGHFAMAFSLFTNDGSRDLTGLILLLVGVAAWGKALAGVAERAPLDLGEAGLVAWLAALASTLLAVVRAPGYHIRGGLGVYYVLAAAVVVLVASYALDIRARGPTKPPLLVARRLLLFLLAFALGAWLLKASPEPLADVFPVHQQTAQAMLDGKSIYEPGAIHVLDTNHHDYLIRTYVYPPLSAYLTAIAYAMTRDVRWANLVSQLVGACLLWFVARRCAGGADGGAPSARDEPGGRRAPLAPETWADLLAASLLFYPRGLVVLEKAYNDPLALPFLGGFVLLALAKRPFAASVSLGLLCAVKQHLVLYVPFLMLVPGVGLTGVAIAGVVALLTLAPYLTRAPLDLYRGLFASIASGSPRTDGLCIPAELSLLGVVIPSWVGFLAALVPLAWIRRVPREVGPLLLGSCLVFGLFYTCGRQAFLNYYYLLDATALFAVAALAASRASSASPASTT